MPELISVIVTTYNREDALEAVLSALSCQTDRNFEILIADDGSSAATAALIEGWKQRLRVPLTHVWQADRGFRAAEIRNRAILASGGDYCIFLDGDCIPRPDFVASHGRLAQRGWFVTGNRVLLSPELTATVLRKGLRPATWGFAEWLRRRRQGGVNRLAAVMRLPLGPLRRLRPTQWLGARSCNLAVWRSDLDLVDGFDASFSGWGKEDSDLLVRLIHAGVRRKDGRFATGVIHLWHRESDRSRLTVNEARLDVVVRSARARAERGLSVLGAERREGRSHDRGNGLMRDHEDGHVRAQS